MITGALLAAAAVAWACSGHYASSLLEGDGSSLREVSSGSFQFQLSRIAPAYAPRTDELPPFSYSRTDTDQLDLAELDAELRARRVPQARRTRIVERTAALREAIALHRERRSAWAWKNRHKSSTRGAPRLTGARVPDGLPIEFDLYLRGAVLYHADRYDEAARHWRRLLRLPRHERRNRTIWASYMLGRVEADRRPARAVRYLRRTRREYANGFHDPLRLSAESLGWEARAEMRRGRFGRAAELYLTEFAYGDTDAEDSLLVLARRVVAEGPAELRRAAKHPTLRGVITAYVVSRGDFDGPAAEAPTGELARVWLAAVESAASDEVDGAEHLAWIAYRHGEYAVADRWIARAAPDLPLVPWLQARLRLREGSLDAAASLLDEAATRYTALGDVWTEPGSAEDTYTELGGLRLVQGRYADALRAFMLSEVWKDTAYVAERVLTVEELRDLIDGDRLPEAYTGHVRELLFRRMVRAGRFEEAQDYASPALEVELGRYVEAIDAVEVDSLDESTRIGLLLHAAETTRAVGSRILATELAPDWGMTHGYGPIASLAEVRSGVHGSQGVLTASEDERRRIREHRVEPHVYEHWEFLANDLVWKAVTLMPDEREETAAVLAEELARMSRPMTRLGDSEGRRSRRLWDALVERCGSTALGQEARRNGPPERDVEEPRAK